MSVYMDGFDVATGMGRYWEKETVPTCPHPDGSANAALWHEGYNDGLDELEMWPDITAAKNWVAPPKQEVMDVSAESQGR